ncbi:hypothetical protein H310_12335 [Aphanomyces invadans]|uniref:Integrase catalytic domain-containing protein n=1 Tax=Aphanomyces invadans TaxID=157072 RepID=A0A024TID7_9STRA|nr:hypothetical protein H310_12335 [Aphanomyces invadans]ETV93769.1 hypothetical protein H310_12335 [Aphanomyces invadans]|eukprot:XP_008877578.1 hypothetical protein H310_12335 [Aphanomyces invadans]
MDGGYILVAKDDFSQFKRLWETDVANAQVVARCLLQWFSVFGMCYHWVSDRGSHFKNECPWANGTVESAMKTTLKKFRALLSEWLMQPDQWRLIVPVVMHVLNQSPSETLGGTSPITAMTGGPAMSPLDRLALPGPTKITTLEELWSLRQEELKSLVLSLDSMHEKIVEASSKKRLKKRQRRLKTKGVEMAQLDVGDFVLYMDVWSMSPSKLSVTWREPAQVVKTTSDWIFENRNLVTG